MKKPVTPKEPVPAGKIILHKKLLLWANYIEERACVSRKYWRHHTNSLSLANFVGSVVGFLNVLIIRLRSLLLAAALSFEIEMVYYDV